jgi:protein-disulfide isomerase
MAGAPTRTLRDLRPLPALLACLAAVAPAAAGAAEVPAHGAAVLSSARPGRFPARGPRDALVTVELFCNFAHVACTQSERVLHDLADRHPGSLRVVYHQVVLPFRDSQTIAEATLEAWHQGRFLELADLAAAAAAPLRARDLDAIAARAGLDLDALHRALADHRHAAAVERDGLLRDRLGIPTFALLWNGVPQSPDLTADGFERAYAQAAERARTLLAEGVPAERLFSSLRADAARARAREAVAGVDAAAQRTRIPTRGAPARGAADPDVVVVLFSDFECPFCRRAAENVGRLVALYPERVRLVWKHLPVSFHPIARAAADLGACAALQGRFWELHDAIFAPGSRFFGAELERIAERAGVDLPRARADLASGRCAARVDEDMADARAAAVEAAPTVFVNGLRLTGAQGLGALRAVLEAELAPGLLQTYTGRSP